MPRQIGHRKQQIAHLFFDPLEGCAGVLRLDDLGRFFGNFLDHFGRTFPIESDASGAL